MLRSVDLCSDSHGASLQLLNNALTMIAADADFTPGETDCLSKALAFQQQICILSLSTALYHGRWLRLLSMTVR